MRSVMAICALVLALTWVAARPAHSGAWLRDPDTGFLGVSGSYRRVQGPPGLPDGIGYETTFYAEYGLARWLTMGLDVNDRTGATGHVLAFARVPLTSPTRHDKLALQLGLGAHHVQSAWFPMHKLTLSWGRGLQTAWGSGWVNVDAAIERREGGPPDLYKLDLTAGLTPARGVRPALQIETAQARGGRLGWSVIPGMTYRAGSGAVWFAGVEARRAQARSIGLKLALWRDF